MTPNPDEEQEATPTEDAAEQPDVTIDTAPPEKHEASTGRRRGGKPELSPEEQVMAELGAILVANRDKAKTEEEAVASLEEMGEVLGKLDDEQFKRVMATDAFQRAVGNLQVKAAEGGSLPPGSVIRDATGREVMQVPWSYEEMCKSYEMVTWTARMTGVITVNEVGLQVYDGFENYSPICFKQVHDEALAKQRDNLRDHDKYLKESPNFYADAVEVGIGWHKMTTEELLAQPGNREV